jgi:hypothetical protein
MARQCPRGHDDTKPGEGIDGTSASHHHSPAPDLAKGKAKQLETKLEVAMAEIQGAGGDGAESIEGVIDQISRIGRSAIARSTDCCPSRRLTLVEVVEIERDGSGATQLPEHGREEGER